MFDRSGEMRNALDGGGTGADDAHPLIRQLGKVISGVAVIPPAGVKRMSTEIRNTGDAGKFGLLQVSVAHRDEPRPDRVSVVRGDDPAGKL
jgi:hypothetical protein